MSSETRVHLNFVPTLDWAEALATRALAALEDRDLHTRRKVGRSRRDHTRHRTDRHRINADLAGLRYALGEGLEGKHLYLTTMFANNLLSTARLYGVDDGDGQP